MPLMNTTLANVMSTLNRSKNADENEKDSKNLHQNNFSTSGMTELPQDEVENGALLMTSLDKRSDKKGLIPQWYKEEFKEVFHLGWSMVVISFMSNLMGPISVVYCGHLGTSELDGVAIANTVINVTGISIAAGLSTACDTLFAQSFGSKNKKQVGVYLQRSLYVIMLFIFPAWAIHMNTENLLIAMGQNVEVARIAGEYLTYFMPGMIAVFMHRILIKYLRTQSILIPPLIIGMIGTGVNALAHYLLVYWANWGTNGSAVAQVLAFWSMLLTTIAYILISKVYVLTWPGWTMEAFLDWCQFLRLAVAGLLMLFLQWLSLEIGTILTGTLGKVEQGAQSILFQLEAINFIIPFGIGIGCNIRVGHLIGAEKPYQAKRAVQVGLTMVFFTSTVMAILMTSMHSILPRIFSSDTQVIEYAANLLPILAIFQFFDGTCGVYGGIMRGFGRQHMGALAIFCGYFVIGLPVGIALMYYTELEVTGLWVGFTLGVVMETIMYTVFVIVMTDWEGEVAKAQNRANSKAKLLEKNMETEARNGLTGVTGINGARIYAMDSSDDEDEDEAHGLLRGETNGHVVVPSNKPPSNPHFIYKCLKSKLFYQRLLFVIFMTSFLAAGIMFRELFHPERSHRQMQRLCADLIFAVSKDNGTIVPENFLVQVLSNGTTAVEFFNDTASHFTVENCRQYILHELKLV